MLHHTLETARRSAAGTVELCVAPDTRHPVVREAASRFGVHLSEQGEGGLGRRMARIARRVLAAGERPILIGTDCPALTPTHLRQAAAALETADAAFLPAADGGYVLIGLHRFDRRLFEGFAWSTDAVMQQTRSRLGELGWTRWEGETLHDIDTADDLVHLPEGWIDRRIPAGGDSHALPQPRTGRTG
jgi:rSAM/selenodomain-associated transferase 1